MVVSSDARTALSPSRNEPEPSGRTPRSSVRGIPAISSASRTASASCAAACRPRPVSRTGASYPMSCLRSRPATGDVVSMTSATPRAVPAGKTPPCRKRDLTASRCRGCSESSNSSTVIGRSKAERRILRSLCQPVAIRWPLRVNEPISVIHGDSSRVRSIKRAAALAGQTFEPAHVIVVNDVRPKFVSFSRTGPLGTCSRACRTCAAVQRAGLRRNFSQGDLGDASQRAPSPRSIGGPPTTRYNHLAEPVSQMSRSNRLSGNVSRYACLVRVTSTNRSIVRLIRPARVGNMA